MKKRIVSTLFFLSMFIVLMSAISIPALAAPPPNPVNSWDLTGATEDGSGTGWTWTQANKTLTLTNFTFNARAVEAVELPAGTTIVLSGTNTITSTVGYYMTYSHYGIHAYGDLTIRGSGTLNLATEEVTGVYSNHAIYTDGKLRIAGSATVNATAGSVVSGESFAVFSHGITVNESARLTATGGETTGTGGGNSTGIFTRGEFIIGGSATVTATGGKVKNSPDGESHGVTVASSADIIIGGTARLIAIGGDTRSRDSIGIHARRLTINDKANVIATAGYVASSVYDYSYGVHCSLEINGGSFISSGYRRAGGDAFILPSGYKYFFSSSRTPTSYTPLVSNGTVMLDSDARYIMIEYAPPNYTLTLNIVTGTLHQNGVNGRDITDEMAKKGATVTGSIGSYTLNLNNFSFASDAQTVLSIPAGGSINLTGNNEIKSLYNGGGSAQCINAYALSIRGTGSLTATGGNSTSGDSLCEGIYTHSNGANLTISGSCTVNAIGGATSGTSRGIYVANGTLSINDSANVTARGGTTTSSYGVRASDGISISGGSLTAIGDTSALFFNYTVPNHYRYYLSIYTNPSAPTMNRSDGTAEHLIGGGGGYRYARIVYDTQELTYKLTVSGGTGSGSYAAGTSVTVTATAAPEGKQFKGWASSGIVLGSPNSESVSFIMPATAVILKATYSALDAGSASLNPTDGSFDKNNDSDIPITVDFAGYTLGSIKNDAYTLQSGTDFTVSDNTVTLKAAYLRQLDAGIHTLDFGFSGGVNPSFTLTVTDESSANANLSSASATFNKNVGGNISLTVDFAGHTLENIVNGDYTLQLGTDFTVIGDTLTISEAYLNTLPVRTHALDFKFSGGANPTFTVIVTDDPLTGSMSNFVKSKTYMPGMFIDVNENAWYGYNMQKVIANAYEYGLILGTSEDIFEPMSNITIAQAITLAARVHSIYMNGSEDFVQGDPWYQVYVDYTVANGIIGVGTFSDYSKSATRAEMAYIFSRSLPSEEFAAQNTVNSLPDVIDSTPYYSAIIVLFEAGIIGGNDDQGTFYPANNISRAEAAAIISRVILPGTRLSGKTFG